MVLTYLLQNWRAIVVGFLIGGLAMSLILARADAQHWRKQSDHNAALFAQEQAKHAITRQSVVTLTSALAAKNAESDARAKAFIESKAQSENALAVSEARYRGTSARVAVLQQLAKDLPAKPECRVPDAVAAQLEGL